MEYLRKKLGTLPAPTTLEAAAALFGADRADLPADGALLARSITGRDARVRPRLAAGAQEKSLASRQAHQRMAVDLVINALESSRAASLTLSRYGDLKSNLSVAGYTDMSRGTPMTVAVLRNLAAMEKGCFSASPVAAPTARRVSQRDEKSARLPQPHVAPAPRAASHAVAVPVQAAPPTADVADKVPQPSFHLTLGTLTPPPRAMHPAYQVTPRPGQGRPEVQDAGAPLPRILVTTKVRVAS